ncbi:hypothetical protein D3C75_1362910 [compost metagenome]
MQWIVIDILSPLSLDRFDFAHELVFAQHCAFEQIGIELQRYSQPITGQRLMMHGEVTDGVGVVLAAQALDDL